MDMLEEVLGTLMHYQGENDFNVNPHVPENIEHYARAALDIPDDEYVIALLRTSFSRFHRGFVITDKKFYWLNGNLAETTINHLTWAQMSARKGEFRSLRRTVTLGEGAVFDNTGSLNKSSVVVNILDVLISRYELQTQDSDGFIFDSKKCEHLMRTIPTDKEKLKIENTEPAKSNISLFALIGGLFKTKQL